MNNIEEQYVSLETAKLAKEKGFNEPYSFAYTKIDSKIRFYELENGPLRNLDLERYAEAISAPTQAILLRWLREKHNLFICIHYLSKERFFSPSILDMINHTYEFTNTRHDTYEEAAEEGLEAALKSIQLKTIMSKSLEPFEQVLVRDNLNDYWKPSIYLDRLSPSSLYRCVDSFYKYAIPYKGNEEALGTNRNI